MYMKTFCFFYTLAGLGVGGGGAVLIRLLAQVIMTNCPLAGGGICKYSTGGGVRDVGDGHITRAGSILFSRTASYVPNVHFCHIFLGRIPDFACLFGLRDDALSLEFYLVEVPTSRPLPRKDNSPVSVLTSKPLSPFRTSPPYRRET